MMSQMGNFNAADTDVSLILKKSEILHHLQLIERQVKFRIRANPFIKVGVCGW